MTTPPGASFEHKYGLHEQAAPGSHPSSRRNSTLQNIDGVSGNNGGLDMPYNGHTQSASWDAVDFTTARNSSPGYPYTPSYRDSYTPYGSDSGVSWPGPDAGSNQLFDEPGEGLDIEYNPADFDGPPSHSNMASPYYIDQDLSNGRPALQSDFLSSGARTHSTDSTMNQMMTGSDHYSSHSRRFSSDINSSYAQPSQTGLAMDPNMFSPRPFSVPSPGSSVGGQQEQERPRSRASSISSMNHAQTPSLTVGPIGEAFDKLVFDQVDSDLIWRNQQQQHQLNQQGAKAPSPPQLLIPGDPSSSLQIPSFGNGVPSLSVDGSSNGGLGAPGINILPATPISGGAGGAHVPFQHVLQTLNERRQTPGGGEENIGIISSHGSPNLSQQPSSRPSTPGLPQASTTSFNYNFPPASNSSPSPFQFPSTSNSSSSATPAALDNFLSFPGLTPANNPRPRALSETSIRPIMATMEPQHMMQSIGSSHPSVNQSHFSPSLSALAPPLSSMGRSMANHRSNSFGSADSISLHFNPNQDSSFNLSDGGLGADLRRGRVDNRHRPSRSEDYSRGSPFQPPSNLLAPSAAYSYGSSIRSQDPLGVNMPSGIGPTRHARRMSGSPNTDRSGSVSSVRASPYPSPSGSPAHIHQGLPGDGALSGVGPDGNPWSKVERQQVTTPATAKASEGRRKGEASFVCPVPGCGSTFTRHFNLKGHLRSHNEERPFKCKWPGCEKGFARQHDCKRHEALHLNLRPYTCDGCKKNFARMDALNRHLKSEGGVDCARGQGVDDGSAFFGMGSTKTEDHTGWPTLNSRASGALTM